MSHFRILAGYVDDRCGSSKYHADLALRLTARGHHVSVVCFDANDAVKGACSVIKLNAGSFSETRMLWRVAQVLRHRELSRQFGALSLDRPDVTVGGEHLMLQGHHFLFPNVPWIYLPHSFLVSDEIRSYGMTGILNWSTLRLYRGLQKWALSSADWTMRFTNLGLRALADEYEWEPGGRGVVNPVGIDLPSFSQKDSNGLFRFLAVGRLVESKNIALAIRAVSGLSISDWRLDIVGGGPETGALQRLALELGCDKKVVFHGHQEDCSEWYRKADLLLFPSRLESLGLVVLEAMGHGTPCLGIRANGSSFQNVNAEIIENGSTGILAKDELDFLNQIKWAVDHRNEIRFMGDRGRSYVQQNHSWERHLSIYEALAQKAC